MKLNHGTKECYSCLQRIDEDSAYCPFCGSQQTSDKELEANASYKHAISDFQENE